MKTASKILDGLGMVTAAIGAVGIISIILLVVFSSGTGPGPGMVALGAVLYGGPICAGLLMLGFFFLVAASIVRLVNK